MSGDTQQPSQTSAEADSSLWYASLVGRHFRTPWEPSGIVEIVEVEPHFYFGETSVLIRHDVANPMGYAKDSIGRYLLRELRPLEESHIMNVTLDVSDVGHESLEVEFGNLRDEFLLQLEGAEISMSYAQVEKLYNLLKP